MLQDLWEVVLSILARKCHNILEDNSIGSMSPLGPHLGKLIESQLDSLRRVLNVSIPDLIGSQSWHFQVIILDDVNSHQSSIVSIVLISGPGVVHVALDDVEHFADQDDG